MSASLDRLLASPQLASNASTPGAGAFRFSLVEDEPLEGRFGRARRGASGSPAKPGGLSRRLEQRLAMERSARGSFGDETGMGFDARQRAITKIHYFNHGAGGGGGSGGGNLKAHAAYVARDAAGRDEPEARVHEDGLDRGIERADSRADDRDRSRAHAAYLSRGDDGPSPFYDAQSEGVDGAARAEDWATRDKRHFRIILAAERGERIADLPSYTREVMARAEAQLGTRLQWIAVDHHDTDNPHTHIIVRGRRANGQDLVLPRDFVKFGMRDIARDVATEWLGPRSPADERRALENEITRHAPTRLDRILQTQVPEDGRVRVSGLVAPNGDPALTQALKARTQELARLGLAAETKRGVLAFTPDWHELLRATELHLDMRKRMLMQRATQRQTELTVSVDRNRIGLER